MGKKRSQYTVKMTVYDGRKMVTWVSQYLPEDITGTYLQKTFIHKDKEGKLVELQLRGEMSARPMETTLTSFPAHPIKHPSKTNDGGRNGEN